MDALQYHLIQTLKTQRSLRGWSLAQAASCTGVSKAMLGQIERGESSPTVATLWKIATGFQLPFSRFIDAGSGGAGLQPHQQPSAGFHQPNQAMQVFPLFPFDEQTGFEMLVIDLAAGMQSDSDAHQQGVIEHVIVVAGELDLEIAGRWQTLRQGEGMRFQADRPHSYRNRSAGTVRFHNLIHYPVQPLRNGSGV